MLEDQINGFIEYCKVSGFILSTGIICGFGIAYLSVNTGKTDSKKLNLCPC
jgi:hypothetical protein